jgi:predicted metal-dependent hydrolase
MMLKRLFTAMRTATPPPVAEERLWIDLAGKRQQVIIRRNAKAKRYTLRLKTGSSDFVVTMPARGTMTFAKDFIARHHGWMEKRLMKGADHIPFLPGATIPFLGEPHLIVHRPRMRGAVALEQGDDDTAILAVSGDLAHVPRRIVDFMKKEALRRLTASSHRHAAILGVTITGITIRDTVSRWGSCSSRGQLNYSWRIVMAPFFVLDYLAAHEVAHRKEMNHSARYWRIVASLDPEYENAEAWLKRHGSSLHRIGPAKINP